MLHQELLEYKDRRRKIDVYIYNNTKYNYHTYINDEYLLQDSFR